MSQPHTIGYLGPPGSWTHQACLDLFKEGHLVACDRQTLFSKYLSGSLDMVCVPVSTSVVGATPYLDDVLDLPDVKVVGEYHKMLGYSLLAKPGTRLEDVTEVLAHPVALEEARPWLDRELAHARRTEALSAGAAAEQVTNHPGLNLASLGPPMAARIHGLASVREGIEEGPHNVTRWWLLGHAHNAPTGNDKTTLLLECADNGLDPAITCLGEHHVWSMSIHEHPTRKSTGSHRYVIDVHGHQTDAAISACLSQVCGLRALGSYPIE